jgi:heme A synthase
MKTTTKTTVMKDRKAMLSLLWIFVMFNFTYADILTLYFNNVLQKQAWQLFQSGTVGSVHITQGFVLLGALLLETAIAMVLLSRVLKYRANRWANIIVAVIQIVANVQSLTGPLYWNLYYALFTAIEIACLLFIVWYAWTWRQPEGAALTSGQASVSEQGERAERASHAHADE